MFVIVATPTNYDARSNRFDTSSVETVIRQARQYAPDATIVVKSTVPVGFVERMRAETGYDGILFSPGSARGARYDNLHPSRIVVSDPGPAAKRLAGLLARGAIRKDMPILFTGPVEAGRSSCFPTPILRCVWPISTNWTAMPWRAG